MSRIQTAFRQPIPLPTLFQAPTVSDMATHLRSGVAPSQDASILIPLQPSGTRPTLFCVHPSGGSVMCYWQLAHHLGKDRPVYAVQSPALNGATSAPTTMEAIARLYCHELRTLQPEGPYLVGGWSMGGLVALEMAHQLQKEGAHVALVVLFDSRIPPAGHVPPEGGYILLGFAQELGLTPETFGVDSVEFCSWERHAQLAYLKVRAQAVGLLPPDMPEDQLHLLAEVYSTHLYAYYKYRPAHYPHPMLLLEAEASPLTEPQRTAWNSVNPTNLTIRQVPGNHFTLLSPPHVVTLAEQLRSYLDTLEVNFTVSANVLTQ